MFKPLSILTIAVLAVAGAIYSVHTYNENIENRIVSPLEEDWIVDCLDRLILVHGLKTAKRLCFEKEYELNNLGYFDE